MRVNKKSLVITGKAKHVKAVLDILSGYYGKDEKLIEVLKKETANA